MVEARTLDSPAEVSVTRQQSVEGDGARRACFEALCSAFDHEGIEYCVLCGHETYPDSIPSDVDIMVRSGDFRGVAGFLARFAAKNDARLVQSLNHEATACYYVIAASSSESAVVFLMPDICHDYRRRTRLWLAADQVLDSRRLDPRGFWTPEPVVEFEYYTIKSLDKGRFDEAAASRLARLFSMDPTRSRAVLRRLFGPLEGERFAAALGEDRTKELVSESHALRRRLRALPSRESLVARLAAAFSELGRIWRRVLRPTGLVVGVLGMDGAGKSTFIDGLACDLAPAFRRIRRYHLRPDFGRERAAENVSNPHSESPRSSVACFVKVAYFVADYWMSFLPVVGRGRLTSTLVIFDRYYHDILADPARYRMPRATLPARVAAAMIPEPDLWFVLDVAPETAVARKGELALSAAELLRERYLRLAERLPNAILVDADVPCEKVVSVAVEAALCHLERRALSRLGVAERG